MSTQLPLMQYVGYLPREDRKDQIFEAVQRNPTGLTSREIGARIGLRKSPHLLSIINEMLYAGTLTAEWQTMTNGLRARVYFLAPEYREHGE